ncbi:MAG: ribbon-helix-helix domain-containing protein [Filomicrobium sp.]
MSRPQKRSFKIQGHRTSISLEEPFWEALKGIAREKNLPLAQLVDAIDNTRDASASGLSSAIRVYVLNHYRNKSP